ncbi:hypothetical protein KC349_g866 [Hortaea werneckii]|nr:hypothetical protein KC349_g866 [Hortaea werneckii]
MGAAAATATAGGQGGVYQDRYGGYWEMDCGYYFSGSPYYDGAYQGTNGIGVFSCFNGCANRPGCVGFTYFGSSTGATTGSGRCFHFFNGQQGNLSYNPSYQYPDAGNPLFGSAYLLQANENLLCPTYNGTYFLDAQGQTYFILCGYGSTSQYQNTAARDGPACLALCDAQAQCIGVTVVYGGAETNAQNNANCYLASAGLNTIANTRNVLAVRTTMPPFVPTTTTTTTTTSTSSSAGPVTPTAPPPAFYCPADDIQLLQENGQNYYVGCGMVAQGATSMAYTATKSWNDCFGYCDATVGCTGFTYEGAVDGNGAGTCFLRNSSPIGLVQSDLYHVGAVKAANYGFQVTTTTTTTTSSSRPFTTTTTSTTTHYKLCYNRRLDRSRKHSHLDICNHGSEHIRDHGSRQYRNINASSFYEYFDDDPTTIYGNFYGTDNTPGLDKYINDHRKNHGNFDTSGINKYINNHSDFDRAIYGHINRANHVPVTQTYTTVSSYPVTTVIVSTASGSTITQTTSYYATSTEISTTVVYSTGQAPTQSLGIFMPGICDIYNCRPNGDTNYSILIWRHIHHILSRHGYGNYIDSRYPEARMKRPPTQELTMDTLGSTVVSTYVSYATSTYVSYATLTTTQPTTVISTQVSSYGVTTTAPGTFNGKNHRANDDCINSARQNPFRQHLYYLVKKEKNEEEGQISALTSCFNSIDNYPNSANDGRLHIPFDNPGHRDLYNTVFLSLHIHPCQHCFWLYYYGNFGSLSNDHPNVTPSIDCREHRLFNDCIYANSIRANSGFNGDLYHKLRFDLSDIISRNNNIRQHCARLYRHN